jgi:hypothetical protein
MDRPEKLTLEVLERLCEVRYESLLQQMKLVEVKLNALIIVNDYIPNRQKNYLTQTPFE